MKKDFFYDIFLICPVRNIDPKTREKIESYVKKLEKDGLSVYYPARDTKQDDPIGFQICESNREAMWNSTEVHIFWDKRSKGSLFDLGMAFMAEHIIGVPLTIANPEDVETTPEKSFENIIQVWSKLYGQQL